MLCGSQLSGRVQLRQVFFGSWNQPFLKREDTENVYKNAPVPDEHFFSYRVPSRILEVPEDWRILEFCQFPENLRESWIFHRIEYIRNDMCSFLQQHCTDRFWLQSFAPPSPPPIKSRVSTVLLSQIGTFSDCNGKCENQMEIKCRKEYLIMSTKGALSIAPHGNLLRIPTLPYTFSLWCDIHLRRHYFVLVHQKWSIVMAFMFLHENQVMQNQFG